jgi:2-oxoglutarate ferredoxin oxidoreductase subunit gamma
MMKEVDRYELIFSGSGGQGIILAAIIFAEAVGVHDGFYVCQSQSYGPEARGGYSKAEVIMSKNPIDYPKAIRADFLLSMNQASCDHCFEILKPEGLLVVDASLVHQVPTNRSVSIPFTEMARKDAGKEMIANMVALGAVGQISQSVSLESLETALVARVPKGTEEINLKALHAGIEAAKAVDLGVLPKTITPEDDEL